MFDPIRWRLGVHSALIGAATALAGACNDPAQITDLRPAGPPEVLAVLVMTDAATQLYESATYCAPNDVKRPNRVGLPDFTLQTICDEDIAAPASMVTTAYPDGWYIRIMFDELLDPDVEELNEILDPDTGEGTGTFEGTLAYTQPVTLQCESIGGGMVDVAYDGYYSPSGNASSWPLGPSLVIKPLEPREIATGKACRITIGDVVTDKSGEAVPSNQRGPYDFQIAPITPIAISPADGDDEIDPLAIYFDNVYVQFNTYVDPASFCDEGTATPCEFTFAPNEIGTCSAPAGQLCRLNMSGTDCGVVGAICRADPLYAYDYASVLGEGIATATGESEFGFGPNIPAEAEKEYTFAFKMGGKIADRCGVETTFGAPSVDDLTQVTYTTGAFSYVGTTPGSGDTSSPLTKFSLQFNNVVDLSTLASNEWSISPPIANMNVGTTPFAEGNFLIEGDYQPGTPYTFTLRSGAVITDAHGVSYTQNMDRVVTWTTQPIAITSTDPANDGTVEKVMPSDPISIRISFNQSMAPGTLTASDYTITGPTPVTFATATIPDDDGDTIPDSCQPDSTTCTLELISTNTGPINVGEYTFTLNMGATISDVLGNIYTQAGPRELNFTVTNERPSTPVQCL